MDRLDLYKVLLAPLNTEKSNMVAEAHDQIVFKVLRTANKTQIKAAFEMLFTAKVAKVTVVNVAGKLKRVGRNAGRRSDWKKAYIKLVAGQKFDLASSQA